MRVVHRVENGVPTERITAMDEVMRAVEADTGAMNVAIKCYAEGGENEFHAHAKEDHTFIVLQGRARFYQPDQAARELGRNEGILIPAGAL